MATALINGVHLCPYCKKELPEAPERKKKCQFCQKYIFVRTLPETRKKSLVTEDEAKDIDERWHEINLKNMWLTHLQPFGITINDIDSIEKNSVKEKINSLFDKLIDSRKASSNKEDLKMLYYSKALFVESEGGDFFENLQKSNTMELLLQKERGICNEVEILTAGEDSCDSCRELQGKVFSIDEALTIMPIPNKKCTNNLNNNQRGFCRCSYLAKID